MRANTSRRFATRTRYWIDASAFISDSTFVRAISQDLRFARRMLAKSPGFSAAVILSLGLGIGVNVAIFSVISAVALRPLPYPAPEELVQVRKRWHPPWLNQPEVTSSLESREILAWQENREAFANTAAYQAASVSLTSGEETDMVICGKISASFLSLFGAAPALGRGFRPEETLPGAPPVVLLSHALWQRRFGGDPRVLGRAILLEETRYTIVGVLAATFKFTTPYDVCTPLIFRTGEWADTGMIGRLKPGVSLARATQVLDGIYRRVCGSNENGRVVLVSLHEQVTGNQGNDLLIYLGAAGFILLITCANTANLLLAHGAYRRKELALRLALGAGRFRIFRQLLTESLCLAALGGGLGLALAFLSRNLLVYCLPEPPALSAVRIDGSVLAFALGLTLLTGLLFGSAPAWVASRSSLSDSLREDSRGGDAPGARQRHLRALLVVAEIALALVLMLGSGLLVKSLIRIQGVDLGFHPDRTLCLTLQLSQQRYPQVRSQVAYVEQVIERIRELPGVERVGATEMLPLSGSKRSATFRIAGQNSSAYFSLVSAEYFPALQLRLKKGRWFTAGDRAGAPLVALANQRFVERYFAHDDPLGQRIGEMVIVGVVGDVRHDGPLNEAQPQFYCPLLQADYLERGWDLKMESVSLAVRTRQDPMKLAREVRSRIQSVDNRQPVSSPLTLERRLADLLSPQRKSAWLSSSLGVLALGLAAIGLYGVLSFSIARRTHEFGIRMALGARTSDVLKLVLREGLILTLAGVFFGLMTACFLTRLIASWVFQVSVLDPSTFASVSLFLIGVSLSASYLPARKATRLDPMLALRH